LIDLASKAIGVDSVELRRRNIISSFPHVTAMGMKIDGGRFAAIWKTPSDTPIVTVLVGTPRAPPRAGARDRSRGHDTAQEPGSRRPNDALRRASGQAWSIGVSDGVFQIGRETAAVDLHPHGRDMREGRDDVAPAQSTESTPIALLARSIKRSIM